MIVSALIFIIALLSVMQCENRRMTAFVFVLLTLQHELFFQSLGGFAYFFTAALVDILIIGIIVNLKDTTRLTVNLINVCAAFIVLNSIGWLMWELRLPYEIAYESLAAILYLWAIISLLNWDGVEDGNYKIDRWANCFRMYNHKSFFSNNKLQGEG